MNDRIQKLAEMALRDALFVNVDYSDVAQAIISAQGEEEKRRIIQSEVPEAVPDKRIYSPYGGFSCYSASNRRKQSRFGRCFFKIRILRKQAVDSCREP